MKSRASVIAGGWFSRKIILVYGLGGLLLLSLAAVLVVVPSRNLVDTIFALAPRPSGKAAAEVDKEKLREALAKFPAILLKLGVVLLGVAALVRGVRSIEPAVVDAGSTGDEPEDTGRRGPFRLFDWALPLALASLVLVQVAPGMNRPLVGDELENYEQHLTLPLKGTLTTMGGANNQLGFSILAWASIRVFGDSPASVRLPAVLGAILLPIVAYRFGSKELGRAGATVLGLLLALWPDGIMAGMQGRSYSLLMLIAIIHLHDFKRLTTTPDRRSGWRFALTLAVACTLHMWFVIVAGAELLFLVILKVSARLKAGGIGLGTPLRVETFLLFLTLGGLGAAVVQAGILPKFLFILTQKSPIAIDARVVLGSMAESLQGMSFASAEFPIIYRGSLSPAVFRAGVNLVALVGLLACVWGARKDRDARFLIVFASSVAATFFLVVYVQKPVYLYARFFLVLPMILAWAAARGWSLLLEPRPSLDRVNAADRASTIPA